MRAQLIEKQPFLINRDLKLQNAELKRQVLGLPLRYFILLSQTRLRLWFRIRRRRRPAVAFCGAQGCILYAQERPLLYALMHERWQLSKYEMKPVRIGVSSFGSCLVDHAFTPEKTSSKIIFCQSTQERASFLVF